MNTLGFIKLLRKIYKQKQPDLEWIQNQGLLAVKIAQTFALRIDFLNEETCRHLSKLYTKTTSIPAEDIMELLHSYTSKKWFENFSYISQVPIGSASVGQVHRGTLKSGEEVVIKIIKKNFKKEFLKDVTSLEKFLKFILFVYPKLQKVADPLGILENIRDYTVAELDLRNEIKHAKVLQTIYGKNSKLFNLSHLKFPKLYESISNENVLVSEYIDGYTIDHLLNSGNMNYDDLIELFHIHGFYMFVVGTFHGDLHPGNVILKDDDIYFIDTGAISIVGNKIKEGLFSFMENLAYFNYDGCAYSLNQMATTEISGTKFEKFHSRLLELYKDFANSTVSDVSLTKKMMETIKLGVNSGMVFEKGMFPIIKSLMYLDGMVLKTKPDAILMKDMREFISEFKKL